MDDFLGKFWEAEKRKIQVAQYPNWYGLRA